MIGAPPRHDLVMTDHPRWRVVGDDGTRALCLADASCPVTVAPDGRLRRDAAIASVTLDVFALPPETLRRCPAVRQRLRQLGTVLRPRNPSLWDAVATGILRQVIRAPQARKLYRRLCAERGRPCSCGAGATLPSADDMARWDDAAFAALGLAFKARALRNAASAVVDLEPDAPALAPAELHATLLAFPGVGVWTAGVAVCDFTNDWSFYPIDDLAVRTWAARAAPEQRWATTAAGFADQWTGLCAPHVADATLLLLAWGNQQLAER